MTKSDVEGKRRRDRLSRALDDVRARYAPSHTAINVVGLCRVCKQPRRSRVHRAHAPQPPEATA